MTILCPKSHSYIAIFVKFFLLLSVFSPIFFSNPGFAQEKAIEKDWVVLYNNAFIYLKDEKYRASKEALEAALNLVKEDDNARSKVLKALSITLTAQAVSVNQAEEAKLDDSRNTFLSGIVIVILAGLILSLLLRYGPQRPKVVSDLESWMLKGKVDGEKAPTSQAVASIFSLLIFALAALGIFLLLMGFLWILSLYSPPNDGHFAKSSPYYDEALEYLKQSDPLNQSISQATLSNNYYQFLHKEGKGNKAIRLMRKQSKINKSTKED